MVRNLVEHAHLIVVDCDTLSPGVLWELDNIRQANRQDATVIILPPSEENDQDERDLPELAETIFNATVIKWEQPTREYPQLSSFRRIAGEDEVPFDRLDNSPLFADLLASADAQAAKAPPFDPKAYATSLNNRGAVLFDDKQYAEALGLYQQALLLRRHIDDRPGILTTLFNIGCVYVDAGQIGDALSAFTESLGLAQELDRPTDEGLVASYIGSVHKQLGQSEEASKWLLDAYQLQHQHGAPSDVENTLVQLADVYRTAGEGEQVVACFQELHRFHQERGDGAGELRAILHLGAAYYMGGLIDQAVQIFQEGVRLSREVNDREREAACVAMLERIRTQFREPN